MFVVLHLHWVLFHFSVFNCIRFAQSAEAVRCKKGTCAVPRTNAKMLDRSNFKIDRVFNVSMQNIYTSWVGVPRITQLSSRLTLCRNPYFSSHRTLAVPGLSSRSCYPLSPSLSCINFIKDHTTDYFIWDIQRVSEWSGSVMSGSQLQRFQTSSKSHFVNQFSIKVPKQIWKSSIKFG